MKTEIEKKQFNWLKYVKVYFFVSTLVIGVGIYSIFKWGLPLGLDFTGGASMSYRVYEDFEISLLRDKLSERGIEVNNVITSMGRVDVKTESLDEEKQKSTHEIASELGIERLAIQNVGPTVGPELVKKTVTAILIAAVAILLWVASQFKKIVFGVSAILAMLHDSLVLLGLFALFGKLFGAEVDFLFVTALLTTLSFSVHDTIVVFDRIREIQKKHGGEIREVANMAVSKTMRRSVINSLTIIIILVVLVIFGGETIRWFSVALLVGAISGTYSSPFVAVPLYVSLSKLLKRRK